MIDEGFSSLKLSEIVESRLRPDVEKLLSESDSELSKQPVDTFQIKRLFAERATLIARILNLELAVQEAKEELEESPQPQLPSSESSEPPTPNLVPDAATERERSLSAISLTDSGHFEEDSFSEDPSLSLPLQRPPKSPLTSLSNLLPEEEEEEDGRVSSLDDVESLPDHNSDAETQASAPPSPSRGGSRWWWLMSLLVVLMELVLVGCWCWWWWEAESPLSSFSFTLIPRVEYSGSPPT
jgi:hypothetical protein